MGCVECRLLPREPVADRAQLRDARLPARERRPVVHGRVGVRAGFAFRGRGLVRGDRRAQPGDLPGQPLRLRLLPARLADECLERAGGQSLRLLGNATLAGGPRLIRPGSVEGSTSSRGGRRRSHRRLAGSRRFRLETIDLSPEPFRLGAAFEGCVAAPERDSELADDRRSVANNGHPTRRQQRLERQRGIEIRHGNRPAKKPRHRAGRIAPHRIGERRSTEVRHAVEEPPLTGASGRTRRSRAVGDYEHPPLRSQLPDCVMVHEVGPRRLVQRGLDRSSQARLHDELLVEPAAAAALGCLRDSSGFLLHEPRRQRLEPAALRRERGAKSCGTLRRRLSGRLSLVRRGPRGFAGLAGPTLGVGRVFEDSAGRRSAGVQLGPTVCGRRGSVGLRRGAALGIGEPPLCRLRFCMTRRFGPTKRGRVLALGLARCPQRSQLPQRLAQGALSLGDRDFEIDLSRRQGLSQRPTLERQVQFGRHTLVAQPRPVAIDRLEVAGQSRRPKLEVRQGRPRRVMRLAALPFRLRPLGQLGGDSGGGFFGGLQRGHRPIGLSALAVPPDSGLGCPARCLIPAGVRGEDQRVGELFAGGQSGGLLLGLGREPAGLRPEFGEDVLDPGQVGLGFGELVLGLPSAPLVAPDAGDLLEQRPPLLWPEGKGLVDHPLADEQEGVIGEVGRVEQFDKIAQADALLVEEVVVLAGSVEPAAELEDAVVDGQEPIGVVEDEGHIGHAEGRSLVGAGKDHVL